MAYFEKRVNKQGIKWRALIRKDGYPSVSRTFYAKPEAEKWARGVEDAMSAGTWSPDHVQAPDALTFRQAAKAWWRDKGAAQNGADRQEDRLNFWLEYRTGGGPLADYDLRVLQPATFEKYVADRRAAGVKDGTIRNDLMCVKAILTHAKRRLKVRFQDPFDYFDWSEIEKSEHRERRLVGDEARWLIEGARRISKETGADLIAVAMQTPRRESEFSRMQWSHIDFENGAMMIPSQKNKEKKVWARLTKDAIDILTRRRDSGAYTRPFPLSADRISRAMPKWCAAGRAAWSEANDGAEPPPGFLVGLCFHDLRHEATSRLFEMTLGREEVKAITRHKTNSQLDRYTHLDQTQGTRQKLGF